MPISNYLSIICVQGTVLDQRMEQDTAMLSVLTISSGSMERLTVMVGTPVTMISTVEWVNMEHAATNLTYGKLTPSAPPTPTILVVISQVIVVTNILLIFSSITT